MQKPVRANNKILNHTTGSLSNPGIEHECYVPYMETCSEARYAFFRHTIHCRTTQIECTQRNVCAILGHISSSCFFQLAHFPLHCVCRNRYSKEKQRLFCQTAASGIHSTLGILLSCPICRWSPLCFASLAQALMLIT